MSSIDRQIRNLIRRRKIVARLEARRAKIEARLARLQGRIHVLAAGASAFAHHLANPPKPGRRRKRSPRGAMTAAVAEVLAKAGKPLSVGEITAKLQAKGVTSASTNLAKTVSNTLYTNKRFKRAERGRFVVAG